jgi:hypothetical protein
MMDEPGWVAGSFEQANIVGDFDETDGDRLKRAAGFDGGVARGLGFEMIFRLA